MKYVQLVLILFRRTDSSGSMNFDLKYCNWTHMSSDVKTKLRALLCLATWEDLHHFIEHFEQFQLRPEARKIILVSWKCTLVQQKRLVFWSSFSQPREKNVVTRNTNLVCYRNTLECTRWRKMHAYIYKNDISQSKNFCSKLTAYEVRENIDLVRIEHHR